MSLAAAAHDTYHATPQQFATDGQTRPARIAFQLVSNAPEDKILDAIKYTVAAHEIFRTRVKTAGSLEASRQLVYSMPKPFLTDAAHLQTEIKPSETGGWLVELSVSPGVLDLHALTRLPLEIAAYLDGSARDDHMHYADISEWLIEESKSASDVSSAQENAMAQPRPTETGEACFRYDLSAMRIWAKSQGVAQERTEALLTHIVATLALSHAGSESGLLHFQTDARGYAEFDNIMGPFTAARDIPIAVSAEQPVTEAVQIWADWIPYFSQQQYRVPPNALRSSNALFALSYMCLPIDQRVNFDPARIAFGTDPKTPYSLELIEDRDTLFATVRADLALGGVATARGLAATLCAMFDALTGSATKNGELCINTREDKPAKISAPRTTFLDHFHGCVAKYGAKPAIKMANGTWSYQELDQRAVSFANVLEQNGVGPNDRVLCSAEMGPAYLVALLATWKRGATFVAAAPDQASQADALMQRIVPAQMLSAGRSWPDGTAALSVDNWLAVDTKTTEIAAHDQPAPSSNGLAYIMFTSGSTGVPKGVEISTNAVSTYVAAAQSVFGFGPEQILASLASPATDFGLTMTLGALASGGTLALLPEAWRLDGTALWSGLGDLGVTALKMIPSHFQSLGGAENLQTVPSLDTLIFGGDRLPCDLVKKIHDGLSEARVFNHYGPTETCIGAVAGPVVNRSRSGFSELGTSLPGYTTRVVDAALTPVLRGLVGELLIAGPAVAAGYFDDPEETNKQFVTIEGQRWYRTGDLVRQSWAGSELAFLGRIDRQIKVRGQRVEPAAIEALLRATPTVQDAAVVKPKDTEALVGFVAPEKLSHFDEAGLLQQLSETLTDAMVPSRLVAIETIPRLPNGKIDTRALETLDISKEEDTAEPPQGEIEQVIAEIWREILNREAIGRHHDFFAIGGHSLQVMQCLSRMSQRLDGSISIKQFFANPTITGLATHFGAAQDTNANLPAVEKPPTRSNLSKSQMRIWAMEQMLDLGSAYHIPSLMDLEGSLDIASLQAAIDMCLSHHAIFQSRYIEEEDGTVSMRFATHEPLVLDVIDVTGKDDAVEQAQTLFQQPFDLKNGLPYRVALYRVNATQHLLAMCLHHIVSDGWSTGLLTADLSDAYQAATTGNAFVPADERASYADFVAWEASGQHQAAVARDLNYWQDQLIGSEAQIDLPTSFVRPATPSFRGGRIPFALDSDHAERVFELCAGRGITPFTFLSATIRSFLAAQAEQADFNIGTVVANRGNHKFERTVGCFFNTLVLRNPVEVTSPFADVLTTEHDVIIDALDHQAAPFDDVVKALGAGRPLGEVPLFQVMLVVQNGIDTSLNFGDLNARAIDLPWQASKFDLTFDFSISENAIAGQIEFSSDLFSRERIALMSAQLQAFVARILAEPNSTVAALLHENGRNSALEPALLAGPEQQIGAGDAAGLRLWNALSECGDKPALIAGETVLTYAELRHQALRLCAQFAHMGGSATAPIVIYSERGPSQVAAMLACLWSGRPYVPVDLETPVQRLEEIIHQAAPTAVLTDAPLLPWASGTLPCAAFDIIGTQTALDNAPAAVAFDRTAYIIFTSGSTGAPKGVEVTHEALTNFFVAMDHVAITKADATWVSVSSIAFDISVFELLWPLGHGQKVVIQQRGMQAAERAAGLAQKAPSFSLMYFADEETDEGGGKFDLLMAGAKFADDNGLEAIWTPERHFGAFGGTFPNPAISSAAVAAITSKVQIRAGSVVPVLHHPMRLCEDWSMIDNLSGGRVGISFASGWQPHDFVFNPDAYADRKTHMLESIKTVQDIWRGAPYRGTSGQGEKVDLYCRPAPVQEELPFWISSAGNPATFATAGEMGANVLTHMLGQSRADLAERIAIYRDARSKAGHTGPGHVTVMLHTFVDEDQSRAREFADGPLKAYLASSINLVKPLAAERGFAADSLTDADLDSLLDFAVERYATHAGLIGSPTTCAAFVAGLTEIGVDEIACLVDFGVSEDKVIASFPRLLDVNRKVQDLLHQSQSGQSVRDEGVIELITRHRATHLQCTPALAQALCLSDQAQHLATLAQMFVGGEALSDTLASRLSELRDGGAIFNMYGPTETTIWSSVSKVEAGSVTLGDPILNTKFQVLSPQGQQIPYGWRGSLVIGGRGLAAGYLKQSDRTAQAFFDDENGARWYHTGDTVVLSETGALRFLGRKEGFEKVNGFRVELSEIEAACAKLPDVETALVQIQRGGDGLAGTAQIVAFLKPAPGHKLPSRSAIRAALMACLPRYACPTGYYRIDAVPLTLSGKINRAALRPENAKALSDSIDSTDDESNTEAVEVLKALWTDLLGLKNVGITDNFFQLGGDSVLTIQMASRLQSAGYGVAPRHVFENQTIAALAPYLVAGRKPVTVYKDADEVAFPLTPIQAWFFEKVETDRDHYNQALALWLDPQITHMMVEDALVTLVGHHSALRHRFECVDGDWQQAPVPIDQLPAFLSEQLEDMADAPVLDAIANQLHTKLDIGQGKLVASALFAEDAEEQNTLVLVLHHLAVDGVSWRILTEDLQSLLEAALNGSDKPALRSSVSFGAWQTHLADHVGSIESSTAKDLLSTRFRGLVPNKIRPETPFANTVAAAVTRRYDLSPDLSEELLRGLPKRLSVSTQEALLSAVHMAFCDVFGLDALAIDVEGHGRNLNPEDPDTSRCIGWFTALYPICLKDGRSDLEGLLRSARAQLAPKLHTHQEFGCLAYLHPDETIRATAQEMASEVVFNYLGQTPTQEKAQGVLSLRSSELGQRHASSQTRAHMFNINAIAIDGGICMEWTYPPDLYSASQIERLIASVPQHLHRIVSLTKLGSSKAVVDEFQDVSLDHDEFDALLNELEEIK